MISVCIPTIGRVETLPTVLYSLAIQEGISEVLIYDEASKPVCESFAVNQILDLLSLKGVQTKVIRKRGGKGIGPARAALIVEASCDHIFLLDDDVVVAPRCIDILEEYLIEGYAWAVPSCLLLNASLGLDGYTDREVSSEDPSVMQWVEKYPWFAPYFRYADRVVCRDLICAGTQCIGLNRNEAVKALGELCASRALPREDTLLTRLIGPGVFDSLAVCYHVEHSNQQNRGEWESRMFYRLHEVIIENPRKYIELMGYQDAYSVRQNGV